MNAANFKPVLIIPVYNHGATIGKTIEAVAAWRLPCIIVNDGSDDQTVAEIDRIDKEYSWVHAIHCRRNRGKGAAVGAGIRTARAQGFSHAIQIDADLQHDTNDIPRFVEAAKRQSDALVLGLPRFDASVPRHRLYGRWITHVWVWVETLSRDIGDSMCGFRVYPVERTAMILATGKVGKRMDFDTEIAVRLYWSGVPVVNIETRVCYPQAGVSNFRLIRDNMMISWMHCRLSFGMIPRIPSLLRRRFGRGDAEQPWFAMRERGALSGLLATMWIYRIFGMAACRLVLYPIISFFYVTGRSARQASRAYLTRLHAVGRGKTVLPREPSFRTGFRHFMDFGLASLDKLAAWTGDFRQIRISGGQDLIIERARQGGGGVILSGHLGNIEVLRALAEETPDLTINALMYTRHAQKFNDILRRANPNTTTHLIPAESISVETSMLLKERVEKGEFVAMLADRPVTDNSDRDIHVSFLDRPARFPAGPFILAAILKCPVYLVFCLKQDSEYYTLHIERFADVIALPRRNRNAVLRTWVQRYVSRLEHFCDLAPFQWFNFYDIWDPGPHSRTASEIGPHGVPGRRDPPASHGDVGATQYHVNHRNRVN